MTKNILEADKNIREYASKQTDPGDGLYVQMREGKRTPYTPDIRMVVETTDEALGAYLDPWLYASNIYDLVTVQELQRLSIDQVVDNVKSLNKLLPDEKED